MGMWAAAGHGRPYSISPTLSPLFPANNEDECKIVCERLTSSSANYLREVFFCSLLIATKSQRDETRVGKFLGLSLRI